MKLLPRVQGQFFPEKRARQAKVAEGEGKGVMVLSEQRSREMSPRAEPAVFARSHGARSCVFLFLCYAPPGGKSTTSLSSGSAGWRSLPAACSRRAHGTAGKNRR